MSRKSKQLQLLDNKEKIQNMISNQQNQHQQIISKESIFSVIIRTQSYQRSSTPVTKKQLAYAFIYLDDKIDRGFAQIRVQLKMMKKRQKYLQKKISRLAQQFLQFKRQTIIVANRFGLTLQKLSQQLKRFDEKIDTKIDELRNQIKQQMNNKMDKMEERLIDRMDKMENRLKKYIKDTVNTAINPTHGVQGQSFGKRTYKSISTSLATSLTKEIKNNNTLQFIHITQTKKNYQGQKLVQQLLKNKKNLKL